MEGSEAWRWPAPGGRSGEALLAKVTDCVDVVLEFEIKRGEDNNSTLSPSPVGETGWGDVGKGLDITSKTSFAYQPYHDASLKRHATLYIGSRGI